MSTDGSTTKRTCGCRVTFTDGAGLRICRHTLGLAVEHTIALSLAERTRLLQNERTYLEELRGQEKELRRRRDERAADEQLFAAWAAEMQQMRTEQQALEESIVQLKAELGPSKSTSAVAE